MTELIRPSRRALITGLASLIAAPAIVRVSSIMPVKVMRPSLSATLYNNEWLRHCMAATLVTIHNGHLFYVVKDSPQTIFMAPPEFVEFMRLAGVDDPAELQNRGLGTSEPNGL